MTLLALILSLAAERFLGALEDLRQFNWFHRYLDFVQQQLKNIGMVGAALCLLVFALPLGYVFYKLADYGLIYFAVSTVALLYCLGPKTFYEDAKAYCGAMETGNLETAEWYATELLNRPLDESEKQHLNYTVLQAVFIAASERLLAVIFWFVLLGPWGAIMYRLSSQANQWARMQQEQTSTFSAGLGKINLLVNWLPARLIAMSYAITGNFMESMSQCRAHTDAYCPATRDPNERALVCAGVGAMGIEAKDPLNDKRLLENALSLLRRTVVFWVGVVAFLTLAGMLK